jgi:hypothetical protein
MAKTDARNARKKQTKIFSDLRLIASQLKVSPSHLYRVVSGRRPSSRLLRRYRIIAGQKFTKSKRFEISLPAGAVFTFTTTLSAISLEAMLPGCRRDDTSVTLDHDACLLFESGGTKPIHLSIKPAKETKENAKHQK